MYTVQGEKGPSSKKNNVGRVVHPYSTDLTEFFKQPLQDAGNPGLSRICGYCVFTRKQLLPDLTARDCEQFLVLGKCMFGTKCKFDHRTTNKKQITDVKDKLKRFKDDPLGLAGEKPQQSGK